MAFHKAYWTTDQCHTSKSNLIPRVEGCGTDPYSQCRGGWIRTCLLPVVMLCLLSELSLPVKSMYINMYEGDKSCNNELSDPVGKIDFSSCVNSSQIAKDSCRCQWQIAVPGTLSYTVFIFRTARKFDGNEVPRRRLSEVGRVFLSHGHSDVVTWHTNDSAVVIKAYASSIRVLFNPGNRINTARSPDDLPNNVAFTYVAHITGSSEEILCSKVVDQKIPNGYIKVKDRTLGSKAEIRCDDGFELNSPDIHPICNVRNGKLVWDNFPVMCLPSCPRPNPIKHGVVRVRMVSGTFYRNNQTDWHPKKTQFSMNMSNVAVYTCEKPYVLEGSRFSICKFDDRINKSIWMYKPPRCVIPTCSNPITLDGKYGSIVQPFYPNSLQNVHDRIVKCQWIFKMKRPSVVKFKIHILDLPNCPKSSIRFLSRLPIRYNVVEMITNSSVHKGAFSLRVSNLIVTYQHSASCNVKGRGGFYLSYIITPIQRLRRDASAMRNPSARPSQQPGTSTSLWSQDAIATQNPPNPTTPDTGEKESDSSDTWKIVVGVIIPALILGIILFAAYKVYRRKFPVRMILGREFGKFRNPSYHHRARTGLTLVREDTDCNASANRMSIEYNPDFQRSDYRIPCENKGFEDDEIHYGRDEDKADREFRMRKSWLFGKKEDETKAQHESNEAISEDNHAEDEDENLATITKQDREFSDDSDIETMLQKQKVTPMIRRKGLSESDLSNSSSSSEKIAVTNTRENGSSHSLTITDVNNINSYKAAQKKLDLVEQFEHLFEHPSFEEVRAQLKARARSTSGSKALKMVRPRSRSLQIDPSKSARRSSSSPFEIPIAEQEHLQTIHNQAITASVVGFSLLSASVRSVVSMSSINSNSHLVTDLDEDISDDSGSVNLETQNIHGDQEEIKNGETKPETRALTIQDETRETLGVKEFKQDGKLKRIAFHASPLSMEPVEESKSSDELSIQNETELSDKKGDEKGVNDEDDGSSEDNDDESINSTSGSSSSDTHFEDHDVNVTKIGITPQTSITTDSSVVKLEKENETEWDNKAETPEENMKKQHNAISEEKNSDQLVFTDKLCVEVNPIHKEDSLKGRVVNSVDRNENFENDEHGVPLNQNKNILAKPISDDVGFNDMKYDENPDQIKDDSHHCASGLDMCRKSNVDSNDGSETSVGIHDKTQETMDIAECGANASDVSDTASYLVSSRESDFNQQLTNHSPSSGSRVESSSPDCRKVRIIREIELSDASSDSSDVLHEGPKTISADTDRSAPSAGPELKKITFDLSNSILNDDDDDDDDEDYEDDDDEDDDDDDEDEKHNDGKDDDDDDEDEKHNDGQDDNDDKNNVINNDKENSDRDVTDQNVKVSYGENEGEMKRLGGSDVGGDGFIVINSETQSHRERTGTDSSGIIDVCNEFLDDATDNMILLSTSGDRAVGTDNSRIKNLDANSNLTGQRTVAIDPDVKFSFNWKTHVKVGEEDDDDEDIDV